MRKNEIVNKGWNFAQVPADVILDAELLPIDVRLYAYLQWRAGTKGSSFPGLEITAKDIHSSVGNLRHSYRRLLKAFWVKRFRRYGKSSLTVIYANKSDARLDHGRTHEAITGDLMNGSPVSRLNDSKINDNKINNAADAANPSPPQPTEQNITHPAVEFFGIPAKPQIKAPTTAEGRKARLAATLARGAETAASLTDAIRTATGREVSTRNKTVAEYLENLREWGATPESIAKCAEYVHELYKWRDVKTQNWKPTLMELWENYRASQAVKSETEVDLTTFKGKKYNV
jgi:hypothetical protein